MKWTKIFGTKIEKNLTVERLMGFLVISLTTFYDGYINWPKLTEQKIS